ncbi:hypothetical protein [Bifidobacterium asteroides]|uniref:Uncharacterized protein n=1 Tax=Bifidobacterium asteroides TaxID=1684 RepID=A0ABS3IW67_9BIFI|nr:hypothetical protein [Bifidobacterium asteroides]MCP8613659.1 hypothetical protein [Bifidobacterium asteroides]
MNTSHEQATARATPPRKPRRTAAPPTHIQSGGTATTPSSPRKPEPDDKQATITPPSINDPAQS